MLRKSNKSIPSVKRIFAKQNLKVAFLVPTPTGLTKGYMDAIKSFREYLKKEKTRDYIKLMWKNFIYLKVVNDDTINKNQFKFTKMSDSKDITNEIGT